MSDRSLFRANLDAMFTKPMGEHQRRMCIHHLQVRLDQCKQFYPWPAFEQSLQRDIDRLENHSVTRKTQRAETSAPVACTDEA